MSILSTGDLLRIETWMKGDSRPTDGRRTSVIATVLIATAAVAVTVIDILVARHTTGVIVFLLYWLGFFMALGTALFVGLTRRSVRAQDLTLAAFALFTYIPKFLMSVSGPRYFDEYGQFRHLQDVFASGNLFEPSSYQPIISRFPGLPAAIGLVHWVTGLSPWHSGQVVVVLAHVAMLLIVAAVARTVGASSHMALLGALVYGLNPSFAFFDTQLGYESVGLPLAFLAVLGCLRAFAGKASGGPRTSAQRASSRAWTAVGMAAFAACAVTHHLSALFAVGACLLIAVVVTVASLRHPASHQLTFGWLVTCFGVVATAAWLGLVAPSVGSYLGPHFHTALEHLLQVVGLRPDPQVDGQLPSNHTLFSGSQLPLFEKAAALVAPLIAIGLSVAAVGVLWRTRRVHSNVMTVPFAVIAAAYAGSLPFALTTGGGEIAHRSWGYSYLGTAVLLAVAGSRLADLPARHVRQRPARFRAVICGLLVPLAIGNTAVGVDIWYRFPGPYEFGTDTRSGSAELDSVVRWLDENAPAGVGVVTDRFTSQYVTGYTDLQVPTPTQVLPLSLFAAPVHPPIDTVEALEQGGFEFFVVDRHILSETPHIEFYPGASSWLPVDRRALRDLTDTPLLTQVFRTSHYAVYRIG
jgi:hypothetical protein